MNYISTLLTVGMALTLTLTSASIPSIGLQTARVTRMDLPDSAFKIDPRRGLIVRTPNFVGMVADVSNFPALGATDVQTQIVRVHLRAGKSFFRHYHPRSSEILTCLRGSLEVSFSFERSNPRVVMNIIRTGQSTVIPQGLLQTTRCISKTNCTYLSVFTSADPGIVPIPES